MKKPHPLTAIAVFTGLAGLLLIGLSCSNQPASFKLAVKYDPVGTAIQYKLESHRVGSVYKGDELIEDFDVKVEGDIIYTTQKVLANGDCIVLEENIWSWDEPADDSGQMKRITRDYAYKYVISTAGKMTDLKMLGKSSQSWEDYVRNFVEQGMPIFPDETVTAGYAWTQVSSVVLPDSQKIDVSMKYTIKGTSNKQGYHCAIIDYKGNLAIPLFRDPADSMSAFGVDWIELNGILYFAIDAGKNINAEERRRVVSKRTYLDKKTGEPVERRHEFEATISSNLVSPGSG